MKRECCSWIAVENKKRKKSCSWRTVESIYDCCGSMGLPAGFVNRLPSKKKILDYICTLVGGVGEISMTCLKFLTV
jgi:hypothetical protein